jgi:hypothetical protein
MQLQVPVICIYTKTSAATDIRAKAANPRIFEVFPLVYLVDP